MHKSMLGSRSSGLLLLPRLLLLLSWLTDESDRLLLLVACGYMELVKVLVLELEVWSCRLLLPLWPLLLLPLLLVVVLAGVVEGKRDASMRSKLYVVLRLFSPLSVLLPEDAFWPTGRVASSAVICAFKAFMAALDLAEAAAVAAAML